MRADKKNKIDLQALGAGSVCSTPARTAPGTPLTVFDALIDAMLDAVWLVDAVTLRVVAVNRAAGALLQRPTEELLGLAVTDLMVAQEDLFFWADATRGLAQNVTSETLVRRADGSVAPVTRRISRVEAGGGTDLYVVALRDRSAQLRTERDLEGAAADLRATLESSQDGVLVTDLSGRIRHFNQRFVQLWDMPEALLQRHDDDAVLEWMRRSVTEPLAYMHQLAAIDAVATLHASDELRLQSGMVLERITVPQSTDGKPSGRIFSFRDISARIAADVRIQTLTFTDLLTGLANRRRLEDRFDMALALAGRESRPLALVCLNIDHFKHVNDTFGRELGDRVLVEVAQRMTACVRQADTVARLGGDEFVVLAQRADADGAKRAAERLLEALTRPFTHAGQSFTLTASVGLALYPDNGATLDTLLRCADAAMHDVKHAGRAGFRFHQLQEPAAHPPARSRMRLDHAMRQALAHGKFRLHYQPQVDLHTGRVVGAEALIRWLDVERGEISPGEFIPLAEESGFIVAIDRWVLRQAVRQAAMWRARGHELVMSVNVSALQFRQPGFFDDVAGTLSEAGLPAQWLELELTESILIQDAQDAMQRLQALAQLGVRLAIDDFGTGYSSLAYLKRFPIGRLKIDRSFVSGLPSGESDAAIVQAIISMGRALHLQIVAEGVETEDQRRFLEHTGCNLYQGFLFAPALDVATFEARHLAHQDS